MPVITAEQSTAAVTMEDPHPAQKAAGEAAASAPAYEVRKNERFGRYVVATRDLSPGDLILQEKAYVFGPKQNSTPVCLGCTQLIEDDEYRCSRCGYPLCSAECEDSQLHQVECAVFAAGGKAAMPVIEDFSKPAPYLESVTAVRVLNLRETNTAMWERILEMDSSGERWTKSELGAAFQHNVVNFLRNVCKVGDDEQLLQRIGGILVTNAFEARGKGHGAHVRCIFPEAALLAHDCLPNVHHTIDEQFNIYLRAATAVKQGEMLCTSYTHCLTGTLSRREVLRFCKFFDCACQRCADPTEGGTYFSALRCPQCGKGTVLPKDSLDRDSEWVCSECEYEVHPDNVRRVNRMLLHELDNFDGEDFIDHEMYIRKYSMLLHPNHFMLFDAKHRLSQMYGRVSDYPLQTLTETHLRRKIELCREVLEVATRNAPGIARLTGLTHYELHAPLIVLAQRLYNKNAISRQEMQSLLGEAAVQLRGAAEMLKYEPPESMEGKIYQATLSNMTELEVLQASVSTLPERDGRGHLTVDAIETLCGSFNAILDLMQGFEFRC